MMKKNGYGELMARYVGNRWLYIDRNGQGEEILRDREGNPIRHGKMETEDGAEKLARSIVGRHMTDGD
jgi:hypothetical protein